MKLKPRMLAVAVAMLPIFGWANAGYGSSQIPAKLAAHAKVTLAQARAKALKAFPGAKIVNEELEREHGGSGLRYSFDMQSGTTWREVGIDANTGKVLENSKESANPTD